MRSLSRTRDLALAPYARAVQKRKSPHLCAYHADEYALTL